ncbi:hypothetical protein PDIG_88520 [Penicillium digitatum PHI26]|uniref:Zn(2)-C6 fungal-type domain-containing protein n=2 Tax=Penicillium digitatum TaxID=36651 RepID=K9FTX8_PEND2|nr:hypothetical protein PDIP_31830 [Penicillium digitatum Pd1]EKV04536.1 hypothetical protein PDIG_88520 [Penicillium digitatum PHI26]EKV17306.1 hypothetical protein PDIP_31830 [Penicillium digitatum Pd1]
MLESFLVGAGTKTSTGSSLIRHLKNNCNRSQPQTRRRKSCHQCVADKTRCNLKRPSCSRCSVRSIPCQYTSADATDTPGVEHNDVRVTNHSSSVVPETSFTTQPSELQSIFDPTLFDSFFSCLDSWNPTQATSVALRSPQAASAELLSVNNSNECETPGLNRATLPPNPRSGSPADTNSTSLAKHSMELIFRVLRTWPIMLAEEFQHPPLFHLTHLTPNKTLPLPLPLANCITLTKMWHGQCQGAEEMVRETILKELYSIVDQVSFFSFPLPCPCCAEEPKTGL